MYKLFFRRNLKHITSSGNVYECTVFNKQSGLNKDKVTEAGLEQTTSGTIHIVKQSFKKRRDVHQGG